MNAAKVPSTWSYAKTKVNHQSLLLFAAPTHRKTSISLNFQGSILSFISIKHLMISYRNSQPWNVSFWALRTHIFNVQLGPSCLHKTDREDLGSVSILTMRLELIVVGISVQKWGAQVVNKAPFNVASFVNLKRFNKAWIFAVCCGCCEWMKECGKNKDSKSVRWVSNKEIKGRADLYDCHGKPCTSSLVPETMVDPQTLLCSGVCYHAIYIGLGKNNGGCGVMTTW